MRPRNQGTPRGWGGYRWRAAFAAAAWVLSGSLPAWALDPARPLAAQAHRLWRSEDGLLQDTATALLETGDGFLWIGTEEGLARFDGVRFDHFSRRNAPTFAHHDVRCLAETEGGSLWIGTSAPGLFRLKDGAFAAYGSAQGLPDSPIRCLLRDRSGRLWAAPLEGPLLKLEGDRFTPISDPGQDLRIRSLTEDGDGGLWVGTVGSGLWRLQGERLVLAALAPGEITALAAGVDGRVWVGTRDRGLLVLEEGRLVAPPWAKALPARAVTVLRADRQGCLWIGMDQAGLLRRSPEGRLEPPPGLPATRWTPLALLEDRSGAFWIGTEDRGLQATFEVSFQPVPVQGGDTGEPARMVCQDRAGIVWCLMGGRALGTVGPDGITRVDPGSALGPEVITALWPRRAGGLWLGTREGGLLWMEGGKARRLPWPGGPRLDGITSLYEDPSGVLWAATAGRGLVKVPPEGPPHHFPMVQEVVAMAGGGPGPLYLASPSKGLGFLEGGGVRWIGPAEGLGSPGAKALHLDARGDLWIGTPDGLRLYRGGSLRAFRQPKGPLLLGIHAIQEDGRDRLWLGTGRGVFRLSRAALLRALDQPGALPFAAFDQRDGLPGREIHGGSQPVAWVSREGEILVATSRGLARSTGRALPRPVMPLRLHLQHVLADEADLPLASPLSLPAGRHRLEFQYTGIDLTGPESVRFRHRLEGLEPGWNDVGDRRFAIYPSLPPGRYRFLLQAWRQEEEAAPQELAFEVVIRPFLHQRPLFWLLCATAVGAFGWWLHRLRLQQAEARSAVLDERNRMAREIHDHLAQGFTGVLLQLEAAEVRLGRMQGDPGPVLTRLDHARNLAASSLQEARRSVMALRPRKPEGADLLGALRSLSDRLLAGTDIQVELVQTGEPRTLGTRLEEELLRMAQEALTNALRHGKAKWVRVVLQYEGREVHLSIEDDGRGFDPSADAAGYGMRSIRESLKQLKGRIEVDSAPGFGTRITLTLPLRRWRP